MGAEDLERLSPRRGPAFPLGATLLDDGVRFVVFTRHATGVTLLVHNEGSAPEPHRIPLDPEIHRTGDLWHVEVAGVGVETRYAYLVDGPFAPRQGHRFAGTVPLIDPYARAVTGADDRDLGVDPPFGIVVGSDFDWGDDRSPRVPRDEMVVYELHVRGLTRRAGVPVDAPGTFEALIERIPYLQSLGVTSVELMPVQEIDCREVDSVDPVSGEALTNYWGYSPLAYFAPRAGYCARQDGVAAIDAFKRMVRALHAAGIEVILDVVFNHTGELDAHGPTFSFRGLDNSIYYHVDEIGDYRDYTGCGNTVNCNHPVVRRFIIDCLRYWVIEMHVDGFRFDLAAVLARDESGRPMTDAPIVRAIAEEPRLRDVKLIAEAWDAAGVYLVGRFGGPRWCEWNGRFRDDVRRFWRGDPGAVPGLATRLAGSSDLYSTRGRRPTNSVNFVTSHDGFTLRDLVSYATKHNLRNGEGDRDGDPHEVSWNHGVEGETDDARIRTVRLRQVKNLLLTLFVSQGIPMLLAGDERHRTQRGNNNAYCQDNEISWMDWRDSPESEALTHFVRALTAFRRAHPALRRRSFFASGDVHWLAPDGAQSWARDARSLGALIDGARVDDGRIDDDLLLLFNAASEPVHWRLPRAINGAAWRVVFDTALAAPEQEDEAGGAVDARGYRVEPRSAAVFIAPRSA